MWYCCMTLQNVTPLWLYVYQAKPYSLKIQGYKTSWDMKSSFKTGFTGWLSVWDWSPLWWPFPWFLLFNFSFIVFSMNNLSFRIMNALPTMVRLLRWISYLDSTMSIHLLRQSITMSILLLSFCLLLLLT